MSISEGSESQYQSFRDCVFEAITNRSALANVKEPSSTRRRSSRKNSTGSKYIPVDLEPSSSDLDPSLQDPSSLADFSDYLASEIFHSLPEPLGILTYHSSSTLPHEYTLPLTPTTIEDITSHLPPSVPDTLISYSLITPPESDTTTFLSPILTSYISHQLTPPPPPSTTRPASNECELCSRTHLPLTYHHLIPKSTHARCLKRGWHREEDLNRVAWLCRACHSFVHRMAGNEELAREWFTMERVRGMEGVEGWVKWVGVVRWKKR